MGKTLTPENVRDELQQVEAKAADAWAKADGLRSAAIDEGVNLLEDADAFAKVDEAFKEYDALAANAEELRGKIGELDGIDARYRNGANGGGLPLGNADRLGEQNVAQMTAGQRFVASAEYEAFRDSGAFQSEAAFASAMQRGLERPVEIMTKAEMGALLQAQRFGATTVTGGGATSAGPFIQNDLQPGFIEYIREQPTLASIVGQGETDSDTVEYVTQSAPDSNAAATAEDTAANESTYTFATQTTQVRELTHYVPVTLRAMADNGQIRSIIENELALDTFDLLDTLVATGDGTGENFTGIYNASISTLARGADNQSAALHKAMTTVRVAAGVLMEVDYIGLHPNDWQKVRLEEDGQGNYIFGPPAIAGPKQVWGIPVVSSTVFTEGTPLVGNFRRSARLWRREGLSVTTGLNNDDFTKRRVSLLAAMRAAFAVTRPTGFCSVTGF